MPTAPTPKTAEQALDDAEEITPALDAEEITPAAPEPRHGKRRQPRYETIAEEVTETASISSEHVVIQAPGARLKFTAGTAKLGADPDKIEADWQAALAHTAYMVMHYCAAAPRPARRAPAPRSRTPRPAAPRRRGSRRSADKDDDPDGDGDGEDHEPPRLCLSCGRPIIGRRRQTKFCGERCRSQYRRDQTKATAAEKAEESRPRSSRTCRCRPNVGLLRDELGIRCTSCAKPRLVLVAPTNRLAVTPERERAVAA
jgi:hypothetical protein